MMTMIIIIFYSSMQGIFQHYGYGSVGVKLLSEYQLEFSVFDDISKQCLHQYGFIVRL